MAGPPLLAEVATWTILLRVVVHGLTAQPLAAWYARRLKAAGALLPELAPLPELRTRHHRFGHLPSTVVGKRT